MGCTTITGGLRVGQCWPKKRADYRGSQHRFIYTLGRSDSNYRLFGDSALWCVHVVQSLRSLGVTLKEIRVVVAIYLEHSEEPQLELDYPNLRDAFRAAGAFLNPVLQQAVRGKSWHSVGWEWR